MLCIVGSRFPTPPLFSLFLLTVSRERAAALSRMDRQAGRKFFCFFGEKRIDILIIAYYNNTTLRASQHAPVAQLDRVFGYEPKGRGFESLLAYHVGASFVSLAPTFFKVRARSRRCSSFPNRTRLAGLRFGAAVSRRLCFSLENIDFNRPFHGECSYGI